MDENILCLFYEVNSGVSLTNPCYFPCFIAVSEYLYDL